MLESGVLVNIGPAIGRRDVALLRLRADFYRTSTPLPGDVFLVIEVADSSLEFDRDVKRALYAEANIGDYWIVNLVDDCVEVHRRPQSDGHYADVQVFRRGQQIVVAALPGCSVAVDEML